jgi:hypothetical protein
LVEIVEILGRSEQGRTRPFICRGDDGQIYYVKGRGALRRSQLCEWTVGHLRDTPNRKVVVIDHNLAFNPEFDRRSFLELHVFATQRDAIWTDLDEMARRQKRLLDALPVFDQACDNAPEQWSFADDDCGVPADFDRALVRGVLEQCARWDFWKIEP